MITIFNGKSRGIGQGERQEVYVKVSVTLRAHLHLFKGARLGVFLAIALHSDADGWSSPSVKALRAETGYNPHTIAEALTDLCDLEIDQQRVLLAVQERKNGGVFTQNRYLIFPSPEEIAKYTNSSALRRPRRTSEQPEIAAVPSVENLHTVNGMPSVENLHTGKSAVQGNGTPQNGDSPSVGKAHALFPYGSKTIKKNHVGGDGDRARAENVIDQGLVRQLCIRRAQGKPMNRKSAENIARRVCAGQSDAVTVLASLDALIESGTGMGAIVDLLNNDVTIPPKGHPYEQPRPLQPESAANRPRRSSVAARASGNPTGGAELRDPGWMEREIAKAERGEL